MAKLLNPISDKMDKLDLKLENIKSELGESSKKYEKLESEILEIKSDIEWLKADAIKKNLILLGMPEKPNENLLDTVMKIFTEMLHIKDISTSEVVDVKRLGKLTDNHRRAIKIELTTKLRKMEIIRNGYKLKGTEIRLTPEYTKQVLSERKSLKPLLIKARSEGVTARYIYNKLKVGDRIFTSEDVNKVTNTYESEEEDREEEDAEFSTPRHSARTTEKEIDFATPILETTTRTKEKQKREEQKRKTISPTCNGYYNNLIQECQKQRSDSLNKKPKKLSQPTIKDSILFRNTNDQKPSSSSLSTGVPNPVGHRGDN